MCVTDNSSTGSSTLRKVVHDRQCAGGLEGSMRIYSNKHVHGGPGNLQQNGTKTTAALVLLELRNCAINITNAPLYILKWSDYIG